MLKRKISETLKEWKEQPNHSPLVIMGIRQCGKTYISQLFAEGIMDKVNDVWNSLLKEYRSDMVKYADDKDKLYIRACFNAIPSAQQNRPYCALSRSFLCLVIQYFVSLPTETITCMPRKQREKIGTEIYHVMMRSINHQDIFENSGDYWKFLDGRGIAD